MFFFIAFSLSERYHKPKEKCAESGERKSEKSETELFLLEVRETLSPRSFGVRPGNVLVAIHDPNNLSHLDDIGFEGIVLLKYVQDSSIARL